MQQALERTDVNYLRPQQVDDFKQEVASLEEKLRNPHVEDKGAVRQQLMRVNRNLEEQMPRAPATSEEEDRLVKRERALLDDILKGMPSQEEMRKAPPGAVDKHMAWEKRNKAKIVEWKNIRLRLTAGSGERDAANLERYRPTESTISMDNAYIPGKQFFLPPSGAARGVSFSEEQLAMLRSISPALADMVGLMSNSERAEVKDLLAKGEGIGLSAAQIAGKEGVQRREARKKRVLTDAQKLAMAKGREKAKAKREARKEG